MNTTTELRKPIKENMVKFAESILTYKGLYFRNSKELIEYISKDVELRAIKEWAEDIIDGKRDYYYSSEATKEAYENVAEREIADVNNLTDNLCYENRLELLAEIMDNYNEDFILFPVRNLVEIFMNE